MIKIKNLVARAVLGAGMLMSPMAAKADLIVPITDTNLVMYCTNSATTNTALIQSGTTNFLDKPFRLYPGWGLGVEASFNGTNTTSANVAIQVILSKDNVVWPTNSNGIRFTSSTSGAKSVIDNTNFPSWLFDGYAWAMVNGIINSHTGAVQVTGVALTRHRRIQQNGASN